VADEVVAVAFDYGGVLTTPLARTFSAWAEADRIDPESLSGALRDWLAPDGPADNPVHRLETGTLDHAEFGALLAAQLRRLDGSEVPAEDLMERLLAGLRLEPLMLELVGSLRERGIATALLGNSWGNSYPMEALRPLRRRRHLRRGRCAQARPRHLLAHTRSARRPGCAGRVRRRPGAQRRGRPCPRHARRAARRPAHPPPPS
jgi:hypothetical protein